MKFQDNIAIIYYSGAEVYLWLITDGDYGRGGPLALTPQTIGSIARTIFQGAREAGLPATDAVNEQKIGETLLI